MSHPRVNVLTLEAKTVPDYNLVLQKKLPLKMESFSHSHVLGDSCVLFFNPENSNAQIVDVNKGTLTGIPPELFGGVFKSHFGERILPDGRIICAYYIATSAQPFKAVLWDPRTNGSVVINNKAERFRILEDSILACISKDDIELYDLKKTTEDNLPSYIGKITEGYLRDILMISPNEFVVFSVSGENIFDDCAGMVNLSVYKRTDKNEFIRVKKITMNEEESTYVRLILSPIEEQFLLCRVIENKYQVDLYDTKTKSLLGSYVLPYSLTYIEMLSNGILAGYHYSERDVISFLDLKKSTLQTAQMSLSKAEKKWPMLLLENGQIVSHSGAVFVPEHLLKLKNVMSVVRSSVNGVLDRTHHRNTIEINEGIAKIITKQVGGDVDTLGRVGLFALLEEKEEVVVRVSSFKLSRDRQGASQV